MNSAEQNHVEQEVWYEELTKLAAFWAPEEQSLSTELEAIEKRRIEDAMTMSNGNKSHASKYLGIGRTLLLHKLKKYNISD
jgi:transcriptional regulator with PAS, ATPase and Fis domain